jgi:mycothiol S-conjugate amidase
MRPAELEASASAIGFDEVVMLGYRDSGMAESECNAHPDCFWQADLDEATGRLVAVIRRTRPQVIITYNDDQQGYPHPDHLRVHDISVLAFDRAGDPEWYPDAGAPFQPSKLYFTTWSRRRLVAIHEGLIKHHGESPYDAAWFERPDHDDRITTRIEIGRYLWARTKALLAHATQVDPTEPFWFGLSDDQLNEIYPYEDWILARSNVGPIPERDTEYDLFDGVPIAGDDNGGGPQ